MLGLKKRYSRFDSTEGNLPLVFETMSRAFEDKALETWEEALRSTRGAENTEAKLHRLVK